MQNRQRAKSHKQPTTYSAFDTAIYYLTFRDRSRKELCDKLTEKGYEEAEIAEAVEKLMSYGYIDDERYAHRIFGIRCVPKADEESQWSFPVKV